MNNLKQRLLYVGPLILALSGWRIYKHYEATKPVKVDIEIKAKYDLPDPVYKPTLIYDEKTGKVEFNSSFGKRKDTKSELPDILFEEPESKKSLGDKLK
jgi:hypothetical protein